MTSARVLDSRLRTLLTRSYIVAAAGIVLSMISLAWDAEHFYRSYLFAYVYWLEIPLGLAGLLMMQHLTGGRWGMAIRGTAEAGVRTLPVMAVLFIPILAGLPNLYEWAANDGSRRPIFSSFQTDYLEPTRFTMRAVVYFAIWIVVGGSLDRLSRQQQQTADPETTRRLQRRSAAGMLLFGLTITFAGVDWVMSLEPSWYSTIYGLLFVAGDLICGMGFAILATLWLRRFEPLASHVKRSDFADLGTLLLALVIIWAYMMFSQLWVVYAGDVPKENQWYLRRIEGGWSWVAMLICLMQFVVPLLALLFRSVKYDGRPLATVAAIVVATQLLVVAWTIKPAFGRLAEQIVWVDPILIVTLGAIWLAAFFAQWRKRPAVLIVESSS